MGRLSQRLSTVSLLLLLCSATLQADSFFDKLIDPTDGQFDTSGWLVDNKGFLPVPILITEPAVGAGIGAIAGDTRMGVAVGATTGALSIQKASSDDPGIWQTTFGGKFTVGKSFPLYLEGMLCYSRYDPEFIARTVSRKNSSR